MNTLKSLRDRGTAPWLDFLSRRFVADGDLWRLVHEDGLTGVTSNPAIFEKAIGGSDDYDEALERALREQDRPADALFEHLAVADIHAAADVLRPVFEETGGRDGYVSLEVSPYIAMDTEATIAEARHLWRVVDRPNLMVKVPATGPGLPAIRRLIADGINVNITLLFSQTVYEEVVEAYLAGLEAWIANGGDPARVASVASFFVSRIDAAVDKRIEERLKAGADDAARQALEGLQGKVAIANAKLAYRRYQRLFSGARWETLAAAGARPQRLLWASTSTKNPSYRDVLYVEELIGPETVNTMPPETLDAFRDHGEVRDSLEEDVAGAQAVMERLANGGISIDEVTEALVEEGVKKFADPFDDLLGAVAHKRAAILGERLTLMTQTLGDGLETRVEAAADDWRAGGKVRRLWRGDASLWTDKDEDKWLGWLTIVDEQSDALDSLEALRDAVRREDIRDVLLLGMGGSSLGPEVLGRTLGAEADGPTLHVLDSTDPAQVARVERAVDLERTLVVVSSKSGTTLEPNVFLAYFHDRIAQAVGRETAGSRFVAVTDPGSKLEARARDETFRAIFHGVPSIGGRYSVLSNFGLVPAAAAGLDVRALLESAALMVRSCAASVPPAENPGVRLGLIMGTATRAGHDKLTLAASPAIASFGAWVEQLVAESTGKQGKGVIPVDLEPLADPSVYGDDRLFVYLRLNDGADPAQDAAIEALERAGHPIVRIALAEPRQIVQEFFRWEMATAVAGAVIGINPFDQPDVEASKIKTRELTDAYEESGALPEEAPILTEGALALFADTRNEEALAQGDPEGSLAGHLRAHLDRLSGGDYFAVLAYLDHTEAHTEALQRLRLAVRDTKHVATCLGFGPRFLHSTGQAYKGGPDSGVFLQITCEDAADLDVPGRDYSFGTVKAAQARGDFDVLAARGRRALRVHLGADVAAGLEALNAAVRDALAEEQD